MQTKKKASVRKAAREHVSPRVSRPHRIVSDGCKVVDNKAVDLITSFVRKKKLAGVLEKKNGESFLVADLSNNYEITQTEACCSPVDYKTNVEAAGSNCGTIFSPGFHISKGSGGDFIDGGVYGTSLPSEVSAIYLATKTSKFECVDEHRQDSLTTDGCLEDDDYAEFDPYLFIKGLPDLSAVVPTFRPFLLPKQTRSCPSTTLVLDLDETLVHSTFEPCDDADFTFSPMEEFKVYVRCRPHLKEFLHRVSSLFEIIIFTASQGIYAEQLLNVLDPKRKTFRHRIFREACVIVEGNYLKDLSVLGRDLAHVIIVDNSPQAFGFQIDNGIPIESWVDDRYDQELLLLLPFLESLIGVDDVRPLIAEKFHLRDKIVAAEYPPWIVI